MRFLSAAFAWLVISSFVGLVWIAYQRHPEVEGSMPSQQSTAVSSTEVPGEHSTISPQATVSTPSSSLAPVNTRREPQEAANPLHKFTMRVAVNTAPPRKYFVDGQAFGFDVRLLESWGKISNFTLQFKKCNLTVCMQMLKAGEADVITGLSPNEERRKILHFIESNIAYPVHYRIYTSPNVKALSPRTPVGVLEGEDYGPEIAAKTNFHRTPYPSLDHLLRSFEKNEISAVLVEEISAMQRRNKMKWIQQPQVFSKKLMLPFLAVALQSPSRETIVRRAESLKSDLVLQAHQKMLGDLKRL